MDNYIRGKLVFCVHLSNEMILLNIFQGCLQMIYKFNRYPNFSLLTCLVLMCYRASILNLDWDARMRLVHFLLLYKNGLRNHLKVGPICFLPHPFQFIAHSVRDLLL